MMTSQHIKDASEQPEAACEISSAEPNHALRSWAEEVWSTGDYERTAMQFLPMVGRLIDEAGISEGQTVLDIGAGTGNASIAAARTGAIVTGIDIAPQLLEIAEKKVSRLELENLTFDVGDAANLPYDDGTFDLTMSNLGHMYADPPDVVASELARVTQPGGTIAFTSWTPSSTYPAMASSIMEYIDPDDLPPYSQPPFLWGDASIAETRFTGLTSEFGASFHTTEYPTVAPAAFVDEVMASSGIFTDFIAGIPAHTHDAIREAMVEVVTEHFIPYRNGVELEYLLGRARV